MCANNNGRRRAAAVLITCRETATPFYCVQNLWIRVHATRLVSRKLKCGPCPRANSPPPPRVRYDSKEISNTHPSTNFLLQKNALGLQVLDQLARQLIDRRNHRTLLKRGLNKCPDAGQPNHPLYLQPIQERQPQHHGCDFG